MGSAAIQTTCYAIATSDYKHEKDRIIGYLEASIGLGMILGPAIGASIYSLFGYAGTFYAFGMINIILAIILYMLFPTKKNENFVDK